MALLFIVNIVIMLLIGKFSPRKTMYEQKFTQEVDITPWQYAKMLGIVVIVTVITTFIFFS